MSGVDLTMLVVTLNGVEHRSTGTDAFSVSGSAKDYSVTVPHSQPFPEASPVIVNVNA